MKEIGGYFELELNNDKEFHADALKLNSGRNCLLYIIKAQKPSKIYLPYYICNSILEPIISEGVNYEFYSINEQFEIATDLLLKNDVKILYVNYFGLKSEYVECLANKYGHALIIDNTQAFYEQPITNIDTIYSPRKFFGVSDGGYLYTHTKMHLSNKQDESIEYVSHLLGRRDKDASHYYEQYRNAENRLNHLPLMRMSKLTQDILQSIDYQVARSRRVDNFKYLHYELKKMNKLKFDQINLNGPMVYPFITNDTSLFDYLRGKKIYVARYWTEVLHRGDACEWGKKMVQYLVPLPIDHRYNEKDMHRIIKVLAEM